MQFPIDLCLPTLIMKEFERLELGDDVPAVVTFCFDRGDSIDFFPATQSLRGNPEVVSGLANRQCAFHGQIFGQILRSALPSL